MKHNIPCVKFSPYGEFLAAVSIEKALRIFKIKNLEIIIKFDLLEWGWSIEWGLKAISINGALY